jgi:hypothetical protein
VSPACSHACSAGTPTARPPRRARPHRPSGFRRLWYPSHVGAARRRAQSWALAGRSPRSQRSSSLPRIRGRGCRRLAFGAASGRGPGGRASAREYTQPALHADFPTPPDPSAVASTNPPVRRPRCRKQASNHHHAQLSPRSARPRALSRSVDPLPTNSAVRPHAGLLAPARLRARRTYTSYSANRHRLADTKTSRASASRRDSPTRGPVRRRRRTAPLRPGSEHRTPFGSRRPEDRPRSTTARLRPSRSSRLAPNRVSRSREPPRRSSLDARRQPPLHALGCVGTRNPWYYLFHAGRRTLRPAPPRALLRVSPLALATGPIRNPHALPRPQSVILERNAVCTHGPQLVFRTRAATN